MDGNEALSSPTFYCIFQGQSIYRKAGKFCSKYFHPVYFLITSHVQNFSYTSHFHLYMHKIFLNEFERPLLFLKLQNPIRVLMNCGRSYVDTNKSGTMYSATYVTHAFFLVSSSLLDWVASVIT